MNSREIRIRVAAIILDNDKILLIAHKKNEEVYWLLPGGGVKYGESLPDALVRELKEELGVDIIVHDIALLIDSFSSAEQRHILNVCFNCSHERGDFRVGDDERLYKYCFAGKEELDDLVIFPPIKNELKQMLQGQSVQKIYQEKKWIPL